MNSKKKSKDAPSREEGRLSAASLGVDSSSGEEPAEGPIQAPGK